MDGKTICCMLIIFTSLLSGCIESSEKVSCVEGLSTTELFSDPENSTIANIRLADLDDNGIEEIFSTYPLDGKVIRALCDGGECVENEFNENLTAPVRTHVVDIDGDGLKDLIVSDIGILPPIDDLVGKIVLFKATENGGFTSSIIIDNIGRATCAESGDFDSDGDLDLVICEFGNFHGSVFWLEAEDNGTWTRHNLDNRSGAIHAFPFDSDGDGDLDIAVSLSQVYEEVNIYRNDGGANFTKVSLFNDHNSNYGMSGIELVDLDKDNDTDIIFTNGDTLDMDLPENVNPHDYHGVSWLENDGHGNFSFKQLTHLWGAFVSHTLDIDNDGDLDILVGSLQIPSLYPELERIDLLLLENNGNQQFSRHNFSEVFRYLISIDSGDIDGDGEIEIISGSHRILFSGPSHRGIEISWTPPGGCIDGT